MISFKTREDVLPSVLILLSLIILTGVLVFTLLVPPPDPTIAAHKARTKRRLLMTDILSDRKQAEESNAALAARLWSGDENHVGAQVLALVTSKTAADNVKLTAFRPQRTVDLGGISELPYSVQLAGPYSGIRSVMRALDASSSKVILQSVQVSASEEITGTVTATLGISAYNSSGSTSGAGQSEGDGNGQSQ